MCWDMNLLRITRILRKQARDIFIKPQKIFDPVPGQIANKKIGCAGSDLRCDGIREERGENKKALGLPPRWLLGILYHSRYRSC